MSQQTVAQLPDDPQALGGMARSLGITWVMVAAEASKTSKRGHVGTTLVSHVFANPPRAKSQNVLDAAKRLIAAKRKRDQKNRRPPHGGRFRNGRAATTPAPVPVG